MRLLPYACFIWWFYQYAHKDELFRFELELLSVQLHCFILYHRGVEKGWLVAFLIILPQMSALFVMSLIQTAGHTVAALVDVFLQLSDVNFSKKMRN